MPTSETVRQWMLAVVVAVAVTAAPATAAETTRFKSPDAAFQQGLELYRKGDYKRALPALEFAAEDGQFMARYTLAELYSDNSGPETDHGKAYMLYQGLADEFYDTDPDDEKRAPFVAKALTALAGYLRVGMPEIGLKSDPDRAADYLHHAGMFFGDEDAQFELVKLKLNGEGVPTDIASAKHLLAVLTQRGHAGAQAFLADLYWRGRYMEQDKLRAFALITVAVEHAPPRDRIWIEDIYQNIFCGAGEGIRKQATGMVADWRQRFGRRLSPVARTGLDPLYPLAERTCSNGERVAPLELQANTVAPPLPTVPQSSNGTLPAALGVAGGASTGSLRDAGATGSGAVPNTGFAHGLISVPETSAR